MAVRAPVKGRKEGGAEETKEGNGEKREGEGIMGERGGREGVQDSGTLFKLRRVETSITGGAAAAEPPGTDLTVVPLQPTTPSTRTSRARALEFVAIHPRGRPYPLNFSSDGRVITPPFSPSPYTQFRRCALIRGMGEE